MAKIAINLCLWQFALLTPLMAIVVILMAIIAICSNYCRHAMVMFIKKIIH